MTKAVIFDFDGVLVDTMPIHFITWKKLATYLGFDLDPSTIDKMRGASRDKSLAIVLEQGDIDASPRQKQFYAHMKNTWYHYEIKEMTRRHLMPGALELLEQLKEKNIPVAMASSSKNAVRIIKHLSLEHYFQSMLDANDIQLTKPDPAVYQASAKNLGMPPESCLAIEDSPLGIKAAITAGCRCVGIGPEDNLAAATDVYESLEKLEIEKYLVN